jgi:hypothetical protein
MSASQLQIGKETENPERRGLKKGLYLVPSLFTAANILMGFYTVMSAMRAFQLIGLNEVARATPYLDNGAKAIGWRCSLTCLTGVLPVSPALRSASAGFDCRRYNLRPGAGCAGLRLSYGVALSEGSDSTISRALHLLHVSDVRRFASGFNVQIIKAAYLPRALSRLIRRAWACRFRSPADWWQRWFILRRPLTVYEKSEMYSLLMIVLIGTLSILMVSTLRFSELQNRRHQDSQHANGHSGPGADHVDFSVFAIRPVGACARLLFSMTALMDVEISQAPAGTLRTQYPPRNLSQQATSSKLRFRGSSRIHWMRRLTVPVGCQDHQIIDDDGSSCGVDTVSGG